MHNCKACGTNAILPSEINCSECEQTIKGVTALNADHVLKACLKALKITGPTADMFLRRAKRVADEARAQR